MSAPTPERAMRLALIGWGLADLAMGRTRRGVAWLALELIMIAAIVATSVLLADTTWYLAPYLLGVAFLALWAAHAVRAYHRARSLQGASTAAPRSPAATIAWLTLPLLAWGTGFWLFAAEAATPAAVMDRFVSRWADLEPMSPGPLLIRLQGMDEVERAAAIALYRLAERCEAGLLADDCGDATENLLRDVRVTIAERDGTHASAEAELVQYRRVPTNLFDVFEGSELVPVPVASVLRLELEAVPAALGSREWTIVNAEAL
ncbi:MAG TPA: hypothetical protein VF071_13275 [Candidatus Limnocylindria bacterium]